MAPERNDLGGQVMAVANTGNRAPGWWYPWLFVGGMGIVVIVNAFMVYFALSSWSGLETSDHYAKGLAYNQTLDAQRRQAELGWKIDVGLSGTVLNASFVDASGSPVEGLRVEVLLYRPSRDDVDSNITLAATAPGEYRGEAKFPLPGLWEIRLNATRGDESFRHRQRIQVP